MTQATLGRKLEDMLLSEIDQTQKDTHCMIPLTGGPASRPIQRDRK